MFISDRAVKIYHNLLEICKLNVFMDIKYWYRSVVCALYLRHEILRQQLARFVYM